MTHRDFPVYMLIVLYLVFSVPYLQLLVNEKGFNAVPAVALTYFGMLPLALITIWPFQLYKRTLDALPGKYTLLHRWMLSVLGSIGGVWPVACFLSLVVFPAQELDAEAGIAFMILAMAISLLSFGSVQFVYLATKYGIDAVNGDDW